MGLPDGCCLGPPGEDHPGLRPLEPGGSFPYENFVSNEVSYQVVIPDLVRIAKPGGAYLGVAPEQNFTYIVALKPKMVFIVDVRRGNLDLQLMYKAFFETSKDRAEFVSKLFCRPRPAGLTTQSTADAIFALLYTSNAAWNETRWNNADFDKLVNEARTTIDEAKRRALYAGAQKLMNEQVPSIIPVFFDLLAGQRNYVQGYQLHPRGAVFRMDHVSLGDGAPRRG